MLPKEMQANRQCSCGHLFRVHSKTDGKCLGATNLGPMSCRCSDFEATKVPIAAKSPLAELVCACAESKIDEKPIGLGVHDCNYIFRRNQLLDLAIQGADKITKPRGTGAWSIAFHRQMNELAKSL